MPKRWTDPDGRPLTTGANTAISRVKPHGLRLEAPGTAVLSVTLPETLRSAPEYTYVALRPYAPLSSSVDCSLYHWEDGEWKPWRYRGSTRVIPPAFVNTKTGEMRIRFQYGGGESKSWGEPTGVTLHPPRIDGFFRMPGKE
jgi:hypothetical protein